MGCWRNREVTNGRSSLLWCCGRRSGCRVDIDDAESWESALREGASSRVPDFMALQSEVRSLPGLFEADKRVAADLRKLSFVQFCKVVAGESVCDLAAAVSGMVGDLAGRCS